MLVLQHLLVLTVELERQDVVGVARDDGQRNLGARAEERRVVAVAVGVVLRDRLDEDLAVTTGGTADGDVDRASSTRIATARRLVGVTDGDGDRQGHEKGTRDR